MASSITTKPRAATNKPLPATMKACMVTGFGEIDDNIIVQCDVPTPTLGTTKDSDCMIIRVLSCALAPGDVRILSGKTDFV